MSEKKSGKGWLPAIIAVVLLGAGWLWLSGALSPWSFTRSVTVEPQGYFFRVKASYSHGDEKIDFDYVAVCGYRTTRYKDGDKSVDGTYDPKVMIKATHDGGALLIRTPRACQNQTTANGKAPGDLLPFIVWLDDVNDLTYGLGYATPDAYDSPLAQVKFHGATIETSNAEEWQAWRAKAEAEYEQKGMLPGPWGYSYANDRLWRTQYESERRVIFRLCYGYVRLKLPVEVRRYIREVREEFGPTDGRRYWKPPTGKGMYRVWRAPDGTLKPALYENGHEASKFFVPSGQGEVGVPTRTGGGTISVYRPIYPADTFPMLPRSRSVAPTPQAPVESYPKRLIVRDDMKGFVACGGDAHVDYIEVFDPSFREKKHPILVNDDLAVGDYNPLLLPGVLYERDEYVFIKNSWGG